MNESMTNETKRPSAFGGFFSGAMSGLVSGAVMTLVVASVLAILPFSLGGMAFIGALTHTAPLMIAASTLFGGIMTAKRAMFDAPAERSASATHDVVPVPISTGMAPVMSPSLELADELPMDQNPPPKNWAVDMGRTDGPSNRIQEILANGSMSDKDRASAILASREANSAQASRG